MIEKDDDPVLRDWDDFDSKRKDIYDDIQDEITRGFPISNSGVRLELDGVDWADPDYREPEEQQKALLENRSLTRRLRGTLRAVDETSGDVLEEKKLTLLRAPFLTDRGTIIHNGSEYASSAQARLMPGAYTRRQDNGQLETFFNSKPGSGPGMRVGFEPDTAQYRLRLRTSNLHLYSLLHDLGVPDEHLAKSWKPEVLASNRDKYDARVLEKAYGHLVPKREQVPEVSREQMAEAVKAALDRTLVHRKVVERTLPNMLYPGVTKEWQKQAAELDAMPFSPDIPAPEMVKQAAEEAEEFAGELSPEDLQDEYTNMYSPGTRKKRLAGMDKWPQRWMAPGGTDMGWLDWYFQYSQGRRTGDDLRQINRWKRLKARALPQFLQNPTPRRAFSLRQWAIDPVAALGGPETPAAQKLVQDMEAYKAETKASASSGKGCLMAYFGDAEAQQVIAWRQTNIPDSEFAGDGPEGEVHATILYGFSGEVSFEQVRDAVMAHTRGAPLTCTLGELGRFEANEHRPESDCLWIGVPEHESLLALREHLLKEFGDQVTLTYGGVYKPHVTVGYIKPGACKDLDGHSYFKGVKQRVRKLVFSEAGSKVKHDILLETEEKP
jgi:2'-5' RNA ligase